MAIQNALENSFLDQNESTNILTAMQADIETCTSESKIQRDTLL
jgi:hypothetical protein